MSEVDSPTVLAPYIVYLGSFLVLRDNFFVYFLPRTHPLNPVLTLIEVSVVRSIKKDFVLRVFAHKIVLVVIYKEITRYKVFIRRDDDVFSLDVGKILEQNGFKLVFCNVIRGIRADIHGIPIIYKPF